MAVTERTVFHASAVPKENAADSLQHRRPIIHCKGLHKSFPSGDQITHVLNGIDLDVYKGEFLCILGESGCGKTTLLNILGGLEKPDAGSFIFLSKPYQHATENDLTEFRRSCIGFVFQSYNLIPSLTCKQNLDLIGELVANPMPSMQALEIVGLTEKASNYPSQLSGGQQQRVSIARALVKRPLVLLADEPTAALDYTTGLEVLAAFENAVKKGTTLIMITHNEEIAKMANRVIRLRDGRIWQETVNDRPKTAAELVW